MSVLVQISDPHFGTEVPAVVDALTRWVRAQAPDVLLLTGDITQRATAAQFAGARAFVDGLGVPEVLAIPGNHDIPLFAFWMRLFAPYRRHRRAFGAELNPVYAGPDCLVQGLNTSRWWRHRNGEVSASQLAHSARRLATAPSWQLRIIAVHHPVVVKRASDAQHLLRGHAQAVQLWSAAGVDLILGGHIHLPGAVNLPTPRATWAVQAGTGLSSRVRGSVPNSVNLIRGPDVRSDGSRCCTLERWDYDEHGRDFALVQRRVLELSPITLPAPPPTVPPHAP